MDYKPCQLDQHFTPMEITFIHNVDNAKHHLESTASAFWQTYLHRSFPQPWQLLCEQAPDDSRRRVDMKVLFHNEENRNLSPILLVEVKRKKGSMTDVEEQGLDAAEKAIDSLNLTGIYVLTAIGLTYRVWYVDRQRQELNPLHGSTERAKWEYLYVTHEDGITNLEVSIQLIKGEQPMRHAGVVPSQRIELQHMLQAGISRDPEEYSTGQAESAPVAQDNEMAYWQAYYQQQGFQQAPRAGPSTGMSYQAPSEEAENQAPVPMEVEEEVDSSVEDDGYSQIEEPKGKEPMKGRQIIEVKKVKLVKKFGYKKDECVFRDVNNNKKTTLRHEWKEKDKGAYFEYKTRDYRYRCRKFE
ncbi:hypothetical protein QL093DRAFT_1107882 [Fusarium oxysporum]|nr:hypothetical protein QL093DRAFT_1107882 [Fusarium oxysporum]